MRGTSGAAFAARLLRRWPRPATAGHALLGAVLFGLGHRGPRATSAVIGQLLAGRTVAEVEVIARELAARWLAQRSLPRSRDALLAHLARGDLVILASAAPAPLVAAFARALGVARWIGTRYAGAAGVYDGSLAGRATVGAGKLRCVAELLRQRSLDFGAVSAYCNDYDDRELLARAAHPVVVRPERRLAALVRASGWPQL